MALKVDQSLSPQKLIPKINRLFDLSAQKILGLEKSWRPASGTPVFTAQGKYTSRGWTEWTQGFQYGSSLLQYDAAGDKRFLQLGWRQTIAAMAPHVSHIGVHDHGFNNISTYGNLWRLMREGRIEHTQPELDFCELALKTSGAVQAARWSATADGKGYIYSFNGPHSLFIDTMRSLRSLAVAHLLGHVLMGEQDRRISLLHRLLAHAETTARYNIYYGEDRDTYDVRGRTAHETIFNLNDESYRCPNSQQGYSAFSTWTRGLAWALLGFAEQLEFLNTHFKAQRGLRGAECAKASMTQGKKQKPTEGATHGSKSTSSMFELFTKAATAVADYYLVNCCADGIVMWDTGAPNLHHLGAYLDHPANPFNAWEPVDSSAAVIAAQGFLRLGQYLIGQGDQSNGRRYSQAGLTIANGLFDEPYLASDEKHQGLLLHSVYHRPNGWDYIARGQKIPNGESSMWGDYHARELGLFLLRQARGEPALTFFAPDASRPGS